MRRNIVAGIFLLTAFVGYMFIPDNKRSNVPQPESYQKKSATAKIGRIGEGYFNFEIADDARERTQGLSGRDSLADTEALLFVFETTDNHCFWMKDMKFNIDILWFDENKKLVYEKRDVSPASYPKNFCPNMPTKYVAEVTAGVAEKNQIQHGSVLDIEL